jgi:hypothetical protein
MAAAPSFNRARRLLLARNTEPASGALQAVDERATSCRPGQPHLPCPREDRQGYLSCHAPALSGDKRDYTRITELSNGAKARKAVPLCQAACDR